MASPLKTLHVEVTAEDISQGVRADSESCAVARALRRTYPRRRWHVGAYDAGYTTRSGRHIVFLADAEDFMSNFIAAFDEGLSVSPISLDFTVLD